MPQKITYMEITVTAPEDQISVFVHLCKTIQQLCTLGASRTIKVHVDGDGSGAMSFDFGGTDTSEIKAAGIDGDDIHVGWIGE